MPNAYGASLEAFASSLSEDCCEFCVLSRDPPRPRVHAPSVERAVCRQHVKEGISAMAQNMTADECRAKGVTAADRTMNLYEE